MSAINKEQLLALLGLEASQGRTSPQGAAPTDEELAQLIEDGLAFGRRQEILSHLAVTPVLLERTSMLYELTAQPVVVADRASTGLSAALKSWLGGWQAPLAGGLAAALAIVVGVNMQSPQPEDPVYTVQSGEQAPSLASGFERFDADKLESQLSRVVERWRSDLNAEAEFEQRYVYVQQEILPVVAELGRATFYLPLAEQQKQQVDGLLTLNALSERPSGVTEQQYCQRIQSHGGGSGLGSQQSILVIQALCRG